MASLFTKDIVVLDVTSHYISTLVGVKKAQSVFGIKAEVVNEHPGYENGEWYDQAETVSIVKRTISEVMRGANSRSKRLFIGVPGEFVTVVCKDVSIELDRRRVIVDDDIDFLISKGNEFSGDGYIVTNTAAVYFAINGEDKLYSDVRGLVADSITACVSYILAEKRYVDMFDAIASKLGFTDVRYIASNWAQCVSLLDSDQRADNYILINVDYLSSSVSLGKGEGILDMKSFSMGGGHIVADIYDELGVSFDLATEAKRTVDINLVYDDDVVLARDDKNAVYAVDAAEITKARIDVLASIIGEIIDGFGKNVTAYTRVYLTGEGISSIRGAKKYLSEMLGMNIDVIMPTLPKYVKPEKSSEISLLDIAETLAQESFGSFIKRLFNGGKR